MYKVVRTEKEVDDVICDCLEAEESGASRFPGASYEEGVQYAIRWLTDPDAVHPLEE